MTEQELMKENTIYKNILKKLVKNVSPKQIAYDAISQDDVDTLQVLIGAGLKFDMMDNYIFTAIDTRAFKCFDLLIESGASKTARGKISVEGKIVDVEPLELACIMNRQDVAQKLVENGAELKTVLGRDILKYWKKYIRDDDKTMLLRAREKFNKNKNQNIETTK